MSSNLRMDFSASTTALNFTTLLVLSFLFNYLRHYLGSVQCYDQYLMKSLKTAAELRGHSFWGRGPDNAGSYSSRPHETGFFRDGGDYDSYYGRFFLNWYSQVLIDHGDRVLALANLAFEGSCIAAKVGFCSLWQSCVLAQYFLSP